MAGVRCSDFLYRKSPIPMPMFRLHNGLCRCRPVVHPVRPLVSFTLFAGGGGTVVAAAMSVLSDRSRKLDAAG